MSTSATNAESAIVPQDDDLWCDQAGDDCPHCNGEGWIYEADGDPSDWQEDTYCGSDDSTITCRACRGTGVIK